MNLLLAAILLGGISVPATEFYSPSPVELQKQRVQNHQAFMEMNRIKIKSYFGQQDYNLRLQQRTATPPGTSLYWQNYNNNVHKNRMYQLQKYQQYQQSYGYPYYNPYHHYHYPFRAY